MSSQLSTLDSQASVELHIEELVLHGFASADRYVIGAAVERELGWLLGEDGVPTSLRSGKAIDEIRGGTFTALHNAKPPAIGRQIAQAVYEGLTQ